MCSAINTPPWITGVANIDPIDDMTRPHALLQATFHAFASSFLAGILPRLVLLALTFAQPFLVTATISYVENQGAHNRPAIGKALIGAFALVYTGIAVSLCMICAPGELLKLTLI